MSTIIQDDPDDSSIHPLPEDNDTPFSPADDRPATQASDITTDIDEDEAYQEGEASAAGQPEQDPSSRSDVEGYDPNKDQHKIEEA